MDAIIREGSSVGKYVELPSDEPTPPGAKEIIVSRESRSEDSSPPPIGSLSQGGGQMDGMPIWAKVGATLSAISIISGLLVYLVINQVHNQTANATTFERLIDKFDAILEKHDARSRDWLKSHGELIRVENEKTRFTMMEGDSRREKTMEDLRRLHEAQLSVLKQIRDEKKMP